MTENVRHPTPTLSRSQLTAIIISATLIPFLVVVAITMWDKPKPETKLDARVRLEIIKWPQNIESSVGLKPGIRVVNPTNEDWNNVSISLNKQFFYYAPQPVLSGALVVLPLAQFVTKNGNVAFRPASQTVTMVTVFAQIPSGARAIFEKEVDGTVQEFSETDGR